MGDTVNILYKDKFNFATEIAKTQSKGFWKKTQVIGGYGIHRNSKGISELDEVVFEETNMVPLVGVQYAMEMIYGVRGSLPIPTLNDTLGIGATNVNMIPTSPMPYVYGQRVCLFGVGTGGAAENNITALEVKYHETGIVDMVPFRYTNEDLSLSDKSKYYGKKKVDGTTAYYLKRFDSDPKIIHLYKNGEEDENGFYEDGTELDSTYFNTESELGVESFAETCLTITKKDVREWFKHNGNIEECRINSIGLFTAVFDETEGDYTNIQLFSKLNIPTEPLSLTKDMNIIYRTYGA